MMRAQVWFRLRRPAPFTTQRRGRRRRPAAIGLLRPETLEDRTLLASPVVTTTAATSLTSTGATLNGTVNPNGNTIATAFQYGTNPNLAPNVVTTLAGTAGTSGSTNGTGAAALFNNPTGVAVNPTTGDIYVADLSNDTIRQITPAGVVTTLAGTPGTPGSTNGTGAAALFNIPTGVAVNPTTGDIYVADQRNGSIRQLSLNTVAAQSGLTGTSTQPINAAVTGLAPSTTYYFQAVASTGTPPNVDGPILSFTTPAPAVPPAATTSAATSVTGPTATLNASVNPEGYDTTAQFLYGTDPTLMTGTTSIPIPGLSIGSGTLATPVAESLSGLQPSTTYYFEIKATNNRGDGRRFDPQLHDPGPSRRHGGDDDERHGRWGDHQRDGQSQWGHHHRPLRLRHPAEPEHLDPIDHHPAGPGLHHHGHRGPVDRKGNNLGASHRDADRPPAGRLVLLPGRGHRRRHDPRPR